MRITFRDVANYLLTKVDRKSGDTLTNLKLQKLTYYAQAWHLGIYYREHNEKVVQMRSNRGEGFSPEMEGYRLSQNKRDAWKRASGRLTGVIPHGQDGETLSEYISRKGLEEKIPLSRPSFVNRKTPFIRVIG